MVVEVQVQAAGCCGAEVGVELDGLVEFEGQVGRQACHRRVAVLQALEHQRRPLVVGLEYPVGFDQIVKALMADAGTAAQLGAGQGGAVADHAKRRCPGRAGQQIVPPALGVGEVRLGHAAREVSRDRAQRLAGGDPLLIAQVG